jgi:phage shock protein C
MNITDKLKDFSEREAYGVFTWLGKKMNMKSSDIRLTFIYVSFITLGSPLLVYLGMAFVLKNKEYFKPKHKKRTVWEL